MKQSLSRRFLVLTILFVMLAEVAIFIPSVARFRVDYLNLRLERAQIASLALLTGGAVSPALAAELLENAEVYNVAMRRDTMRELILSSPLPGPVVRTVDLRQASSFALMRDALAGLLSPRNEVIRVIGQPVRDGGQHIEVTLPTGPLRQAMLEYGGRIFLLSAVLSLMVAGLLFAAVQLIIVRPIHKVITAMQLYAAAPEDARRIITPASKVRELRQAEDALLALQTQLSGALKQKARLAQLGTAVAKISHDLRNILTSAQLFSDRIETSQDPVVQRLAPKLVGSISRAVNLCESTLAFGRAEEAAPKLSRFALAPLAEDALEAERLAAGPQVSFGADVPGNLVLRADAEQIYRVLSNLLRNARQAIEASGQPGEVQITAREDKDEWIIGVSDTGPGMPDQARAHLFEPFQGRATKSGSGLGLAIVQELIQGHGGTIRLAECAVGTSFEIRIPKAII